MSRLSKEEYEATLRRAGAFEHNPNTAMLRADRADILAENERLRAENAAYERGVEMDQEALAQCYEARLTAEEAVDRLRAENERLQQALRDIDFTGNLEMGIAWAETGMASIVRQALGS